MGTLEYMHPVTLPSSEHIPPDRRLGGLTVQGQTSEHVAGYVVPLYDHLSVSHVHALSQTVKDLVTLRATREVVEGKQRERGGSVLVEGG